MPPRPPLANTTKFEVLWAGPNGTKATNIMYALYASPLTTPTQLGNAASQYFVSLIGTAGGNIPTLYPSSWSIVQVSALDNTGATENVAIQAGPVPGTATGNALPPNCSTAVSWSIPAHYRGGHPRMYLPGVPESAITAPGSNELTSTWRSALSAFGHAFLAEFLATVAGGVAGQLGTIAFHRNNVPLTTPVFYPYSGGAIHGRLDSQRRRLGKESAFG